MPTGKMQRSPPAQRPLKAAPLLQPTARTNEANSDKLFNQMERILKPKLQRDRVLALDIHTEVYLYDKIVDIPATFPMFEVRKADLSKTSPGLLALRLMALMPEAREIVDKHRASKTAN
jgi:hypothetical protein